LAHCREPGEYLIIEDTSLLDYSYSEAALELGTIGDGSQRGFELHSAMAVRVEQWTLEQRPEGIVVGLLGQQCDCPRPRRKGETEAQRWQRVRKSRRWSAALKAAGPPPAGCQWIYVADRESDFYEPIQTCQQLSIDFIIRSRCDRRLADEAGYLCAAAESLPHQVRTRFARAGWPSSEAGVKLQCSGMIVPGS
jgi:hypothetical protein